MHAELNVKRDIVFVGGIHGAGKGTVCRLVCEQTGRLHLVASEVLKWNDISLSENKNVSNIADTQERLIRGLKNTIITGESYLLDGHFCLFDSNGNIEQVPLNTFGRIRPRFIAIVITYPVLIQQRLKERDGITYSLKTLSEMQEEESQHAKYIANIFGLDLIEIKNSDCTNLIRLIQ